MIVVVAGGRDFAPQDGDEDLLRSFLCKSEATIVRHGGCRGADTWAGDLAHDWGYHVEVWPATARDTEHWRAGRRGRFHVLVPAPHWARWPSAGPQRNRAMLHGNGYPARFLGALPGDRGTRSCIRAAHVIGSTIVALR